jgi:hypothetical protein
MPCPPEKEGCMAREMGGRGENLQVGQMRLSWLLPGLVSGLILDACRLPFGHHNESMK